VIQKSAKFAEPFVMRTVPIVAASFVCGAGDWLACDTVTARAAACACAGVRASTSFTFKVRSGAITTRAYGLRVSIEPMRRRAGSLR
jgi:hypothetical protein